MANPEAKIDCAACCAVRPDLSRLGCFAPSDRSFSARTVAVYLARVPSFFSLLRFICSNSCGPWKSKILIESIVHVPGSSTIWHYWPTDHGPKVVGRWIGVGFLIACMLLPSFLLV